ncbi:DUF5906 domain-containing protein [Vibrio hannami]|uniref:phage NrS-1 polymerase family protein n=1 Tax=Vibrio hannami TaxID=2717094 RepID=UPI00240EC3BD|nr:DUF5906 domain-containing protein [Vibrio hannami]MDG3089112.1 DUF5906 domain-containing protein [Vibrio hannami]
MTSIQNNQLNNQPGLVTALASGGPLAGLAAFPQFINCKGKVPVDTTTGESINPHDRANHLTAVQAIERAQLTGCGVGFVITEDDPVGCLDLDGCLINGFTLSTLSQHLVGQMQGAAVERSQSGTGLHLWFSYQGTAPEHAKKNTAEHIELYTESRFIVLTGDMMPIPGSASNDCTNGLYSVIHGYFQPKQHAQAVEWTDAPAEGYTPIAGDDELIAKAKASGNLARQAFSNKATFAQLYEADTDALAAIFPSQNDHSSYDGSSADLALANHAIWWTAGDCERAKCLMMGSGLQRDKWEQRPEYLEETILNALAAAQQRPDEQRFYGYKRTKPQQLDEGESFVVVSEEKAILSSNGQLLQRDQFNAKHGDKKAYDEVVYHWHGAPRADRVEFNPRVEPMAITERDGVKYVNTYRDPQVRKVAGDAGPFLFHLNKLLPSEADSQIALAYLAACVQFKGVKFPWTVLFQGTEGNGKTLLTRCVAYAVGNCYTHLPPASEISEKFNEWLFGKVLIGIEDVYVPDHKREVIEVLKPMITNDRLAMRGMGRSQIMGDNLANFILNSNHKDAIRKTANDRRFAIFYTAQQCAEDLARDGMDGDYFPSLYSWLNADGYAIVANYLSTYSIPDALNPATMCHRAPVTSSTSEALRASLGPAEQIIQEAIDLDEPGFAGGLICTKAASSLLKDNRKNLSPQKVAEVLASLGYERHPTLERSAGKVRIGGQPRRLYVKPGTLAAQLTTIDGIREHWEKSQGGGRSDVPISSIFSERPEAPPALASPLSVPTIPSK